MITVYSIMTGMTGEQLAANWLITRGYKILYRNWRSGRLEIDIIAIKNDLHHCFEIKTRRSDTYGHPENLVSATKLRNILSAAEKYMEEKDCGEIQVDVLAIKIGKQRTEYFLIENVGCGGRQ